MYQFTSESVSNGHPDKVADLISDAVATYLIDKNVNHRAAVETLVTTNMVTLAGEYKSNKFDKDILTTKNCRRTFLKRFPNSFDEEMIYAS